MAATGIRCIMTVKDDVYGFTEVHVNASVNMAVVKPLFVALFKARMALCGPPAAPYRGRMSILGKKRAVSKLSSIDIASINTVPTFAQMNGPAGALGPNTSDQPKSCVLLRGVGGDGTEKSIFLAGVPDPVIGEDPSGPSILTIPAYLALFNAYRLRLISDGWGYVGKVVEPGITLPQAITGYSINPANNLTGVEFAGLAANYLPNKKVAVRTVKMSNKAFASPQGDWTVDSSVDNLPAAGIVTVYLRDSVGVQIGQVVETGTIESTSYTTIPYVDVYPESQTTRKRGNRSLVGPGVRRRPKKIYL